MSETVSAGVTSSGIQVTSGETWSVYGTAVSFTVSSGGTLQVYSGGTIISTTLDRQRLVRRRQRLLLIPVARPATPQSARAATSTCRAARPSTRR